MYSITITNFLTNLYIDLYVAFLIFRSARTLALNENFGLSSLSTMARFKF